MNDPRTFDNVVAVVPARYASSRFPGKPLVEINGIPMVVRVAQTVKAVCLRTVVATDDERIQEVCNAWDIEVVMTSSVHPTGTDRVAEAASRYDVDYVLNVQGDEPLIKPRVIQGFLQEVLASDWHVANAMIRIDDLDLIHDVTVPKVVVGPQNRLLYISRSPIPNSAKTSTKIAYYRQAGIYGFTPRMLNQYLSSGRTRVEEVEDIEILRFVELGVPVKMVEIENFGPAVDLPGHVVKVTKALQNGN